MSASPQRCALALAVVLASALSSAPARATRGTPEQLIPDTLPIPADHLWLGFAPFDRTVKLSGTASGSPTFTPAGGGSSSYPKIHGDRGAVFDFPSVTKPFKVKGSGTKLLPGWSTSDPSGMTLSFWYALTWGNTPNGWFPLLSLGNADATEPWRMALMLKNGVPMISLRHQSFQLFDALSVPREGYNPRVDDYGWHHIVVRVTREHCPNQDCPTLQHVGYPTQPARFSLYVDGQFRGDEVALVPIELDQVGLGDLEVDGPYSQDNYRTGPSRLESRAFIDDLQIYDMPLSDFEITTLYDWTGAAYSAQYPNAPVTSLTTMTPGLRTTPTQVGPASVPPSDLQAVGGVAGATLGATDFGRTSNGTTTFAWLRQDSYSATDSAAFYAGGTRVGLALTSDGFKLTCGSTTKTEAYPRSALGRFQLLALTTKANKATLYQDGHAVTTLDCAVPDQGAVGFELTSAADRWLAWTGSFPAQLGPGEIARRAAPGPAVWNGTVEGGTTLVDLTGHEPMDLLENASGAGTTDAAAGGRFTNDSSTADKGGIAPTTPAGFTVPADGALGMGADGDVPVTVSFEVKDPLTPTYVQNEADQLDARIPLASRDYWNWSRKVSFGVVAECRWNKHPLLTTIAIRDCWLEITAGAGIGKAGRRYKVDYPLALYAKNHVAVAWGPPRSIPPSPWTAGGAAITRREPLVAINGRLVNQKHQGETNRIIDLGEVPAIDASYDTGRDQWTFGPGTAAVFERLIAPDGDRHKTPFVIEMSDVRVYPFLHPDLETIYQYRSSRCSEAGRATINATGPFYGQYCGACEGENYTVGGTTTATRECRALVPYGEDCSVNKECEAGAACWKSRCLTTSNALCQSECAELGRVCAAEGSSFRCAGCKPGLTPNAGNTATAADWELGCSWQPQGEGGDTCSADLQCKTGWCLPAQSGTFAAGVYKGQGSQELSKSDSWGAYSITCRQNAETFAPTLYNLGWSIPRTCAFDPALGGGECQKLAVKELSKTTTAPDGTQITGVQCLDGPNGQCIPGFQKEFRVLSPQACVAALKASTQSIAGTCDVNWLNSKTNDTYLADNPRRAAMWDANTTTFDLKRLKLAILGEDSDYVSADYARLRKAGVGPLLLEYAAASAAERADFHFRYGNFLPLRKCASDFPEGTIYSPFYNGVNKQVCEPIMRANGESCPPPGTEGTGRAPWQFCESSFCDVRGSGTCTDGGPKMAASDGDAGNKGREGKESVKFGIVRVDDTRVELEKDTDHAGMGETAPGYTATLAQTHVPCILGTKFPPVDLMHIEVFIDKTQPTCAESHLIFQLLGYTFNAPRPKPLAGSCTAVEATVGTTGKVCATLASCEAPTLDNLKNLTSWVNRIPSFEYCIPVDEEGKKLPEKKKTIFAGPVPIVLQIGLTVNPCLTASFGFSDGAALAALNQSGLPQLEVVPSIGIGVEATAGLGVEEGEGGASFGASAGVKLSLTIIELSFPIRWGIQLAAGYQNGVVVPGLFKIQLYRSISIGLEFLSGWMGLYARLSLGPFAIEWTLKVFSWTGISFQAPLVAPATADLTTIDFRALLNAALAGQQAPPRPACDGSVCGGN
ncbi:MAG: hypothetical protein EP329_13380 [Deltaproteobacteria bacterium]|nr:MAG: hypothetical protein EP329_13380 [Deltaproteobacteria bacterium]